MIFYNNNMKRPRRAELQCVDNYGSSQHVFQWPIEFFTHHMPGAKAADIETVCRKAQWPYSDEDEE